MILYCLMHLSCVFWIYECVEWGFYHYTNHLQGKICKYKMINIHTPVLHHVQWCCHTRYTVCMWVWCVLVESVDVKSQYIMNAFLLYRPEGIFLLLNRSMFSLQCVSMFWFRCFVLEECGSLKCVSWPARMIIFMILISCREKMNLHDCPVWHLF